jgi:CRP-like cAMP-binding protein
MIDLLREARLFKECTSEELEDIATICHKIAFKNGEYVFSANTPAEFLYLVQDGAIDLRFLVTHYSASKEMTIDRKFKGDAFGWSALTEPHVYTLSALAAKDTELLRIGEKDMMRLCKENSHLGYVLMKTIAQIIGERFDLVQKLLIDVIQKSLSEKEL